jgi:hypothetical protein
LAKIVAVHGIAQQVKGEESLKKIWLPALRDGLTRAGSSGLLPSDNDLLCAFFGDLFRLPGGGGDKSLDMSWRAEDVTDQWERDVLLAWWEEAARVDRQVPAVDDASSKARTPKLVQDALYALSHSRFFSGLAERALIGNLKQVRAYLHDDKIRSTAIARVVDCIADDTLVLVGHSLGSIVAYEALCAHPEWPKRTFVTLGCPLGIPQLIFERLRPEPQQGKGVWPHSVRHWFNIADRGDVVALRKALRPLFHGDITDALVNNDANAHNVEPYLTAEATGRAIALGLVSRGPGQ